GLVDVDSARPRERELLDPRRRRAGGLTERPLVDRDGPPAERLEPLRATCRLERGTGALVPQEDHRQTASRVGEQRGRQGQEQPRAVPCSAVGGGRAAVAYAQERLEEHVDDLARGTAVDVGDEADAAGIEFGGGIEERRTRRHERAFPWRSESASWCELAGGRRGRDAD